MCDCTNKKVSITVKFIVSWWRGGHVESGIKGILIRWMLSLYLVDENFLELGYICANVFNLTGINSTLVKLVFCDIFYHIFNPTYILVRVKGRKKNKVNKVKSRKPWSQQWNTLLSMISNTQPMSPRQVTVYHNKGLNENSYAPGNIL